MTNTLVGRRSFSPPHIVKTPSNYNNSRRRSKRLCGTAAALLLPILMVGLVALTMFTHSGMELRLYTQSVSNHTISPQPQDDNSAASSMAHGSSSAHAIQRDYADSRNASSTTSTTTAAPPPPPSAETCRVFHRDVPGADLDQPAQPKTAVDSTVLMLFDNEDPSGYRYEYRDGGGSAAAAGFSSADSGNRCARYFDEAYVRDNFDRVAASYLSSPYVAGADGRASPYYEFFDAHRASFWVIDAVGDATPMTLDVVYTYVNPSAPSFRRNQAARGISYSTGSRFNDWGELRYALRALLGHVMNSTALQQDGRRRAADMATLRAMGYTVSDAHGADDVAVKPLVERVHLVLSDADQVPVWLNVERFPQLRIVTHAEMFRGDEGILPTLNSNVIESGLHRIPGISRHFLYMNNDQMIGRDVSFFDLFRPLSPLRQSLHVAAQQLQFAASHDDDARVGSAAMYACADGPTSNGRRFAFFESLFHSESSPNWGWSHASKTGEPLRPLQQQCMHVYFDEKLQDMRTTLDASLIDGSAASAVAAANSTVHSDVWSQTGWKTRVGFVYNEPTLKPREGVIPPYYYHLITKYTDGMKPIWALAHVPLVFDGLVAERLLETDFKNLTTAARRAYVREMHPFGIAGTLPAYSIAKRRDAMQEEWRTVLREQHNDQYHPLRAALMQRLHRHAMKANVAFMTTTMKTNDEALQFSDVGPLYGDSWAVRLQAPDAAEELAFWWLPGARPRLPSDVKGADILYVPLVRLYGVPHVRRTDGNLAPRFTNAYYALYHDMFHHYDRSMARDLSFRFHMVTTQTKANLLLTGLRSAVHLPLWLVLNDDVKIITGVDLPKLNATFTELMAAAIGDACVTAPWEK